MTDWVKWHDSYGDPDSHLSKRVRAVRAQLAASLDRAPAGPLRLISACAGEGRDVNPIVAGHARGVDVDARLVEFDEQLAANARKAAPVGVEVVTGDASTTSAYDGFAPAHVAVFCGIFGNITNEDIVRTIEVLPSLLAPGGEVIWTRGRFMDERGDIRDHVRAWFNERGFEEMAFDADEQFGVGTHRLTKTPAPFEAGVTMFQFIR